MTNKYKQETDFVPRIGIDNDFTKIYNDTVIQPGDFLLINNLLNLIEMRIGTNKEFPSFGLAQEFAKLSHMNVADLDQALNKLQEKIVDQLGHDGVEITYKLKNPESPHSDFTVQITLDDLPGVILVSVPKTSYNSIAISTKYAR